MHQQLQQPLGLSGGALPGLGGLDIAALAAAAARGVAVPGEAAPPHVPQQLADLAIPQQLADLVMAAAARAAASPKARSVQVCDCTDG